MVPLLQANLFSGVANAEPRPLVLSYGMGVDSTAVLVLWSQLGLRPDLILFADVGAESPRTYAFRSVIDRFLDRVGFPPITVVRYKPGHGHYDTLLSDCLLKGMMPSLAYGGKGCSQKWKVGPQTAYLRSWAPAIAAWSRGQKLVHAIGYDAGLKDSRRGTESYDNEFEEFVYPLRDAGWDRDRCEQEILANPILAKIGAELGMSHLPPKSACIFCPSSKPSEVALLAEEAPVSAGQALLVEAEALPRSKTVGGLWRKATRTRPASWGEFLAEGRRGLPGAAEVAAGLFPRAGAQGPAGAPAPGLRYAVGERGAEIYFADFRSAVGAAKEGLPLHVWIGGEWFRSLAGSGL